MVQISLRNRHGHYVASVHRHLIATSQEENSVSFLAQASWIIMYHQGYEFTD